MIFIIVLIVAAFLYWSLVPAKKQVVYTPSKSYLSSEDKLMKYIIDTFHSTAIYTIRDSPKNLEGIYVSKALTGCKKEFEKMIPKLSNQYNVPQGRIALIINNTYKATTEEFVKMPKPIIDSNIDSYTKHNINIQLPKSSLNSGNQEQVLIEFIGHQIGMFIKDVLEKVPEQNKGKALTIGLLELKNSWLNNAFELSQQTGIPISRVVTIIDSCFKAINNKL